MMVVINDANILIDLAKIGLIDAFSRFSFELYTTDFVYEELNVEQRELFSSLIKNEILHIIETVEITDFQEIDRLLNSSHGLSFEDCSVWYYSSKMSGILLSGDAKLRKHARKSGVEVRGIIYVFDELLKQNLISFSIAIKKLEQLSLLNTRLPKNDIQKRLEYWREKILAN